MPDFSSAPEIGECALQAALDAANQYQAMSGGRNIHDHAIETFVSSKIAEAVYDLTREAEGSVSLEVPFAEVHGLSGADRRGRGSSILSPRFRFEAVVFQKGRPTGLIEVKKRFAASTGASDVIRLSEAIHKFGQAGGGSVRFGLWLAIQRIAEGSKLLGEVQAKQFEDSFEWSMKPKILHRESIGSFGTFKRSGRSVKTLRVFGVLLQSGH